MAGVGMRKEETPQFYQQLLITDSSYLLVTTSKNCYLKKPTLGPKIVMLWSIVVCHFVVWTH